MQKVKLDCTQEQYETLFAEVDKTRSTSTTVKVTKAALEALLRDHSKLLHVHRGSIE